MRSLPAALNTLEGVRTSPRPGPLAGESGPTQPAVQAIHCSGTHGALQSAVLDRRSSTLCHRLHSPFRCPTRQRVDSFPRPSAPQCTNRSFRLTIIPLQGPSILRAARGVSLTRVLEMLTKCWRSSNGSCKHPNHKYGLSGNGCRSGSE